MRIGITYNLKPARGIGPADAFEEFDSEETVQAIETAIRSGGHRTALLGWGLEAVEKIRRYEIDFVFNIAEGLSGRSREAQMPALLEMLGVPYSGSDPFTLALTLDKAQAKTAAAHAGVLTPDFCTASSAGPLPENLPAFPVFVKPLYEGSSKGIRASSRAATLAALKQQVAWLYSEYGKIPLLIESYIAGREFTAAVAGNDPAEVLGLMEISARGEKNGDFIYSLEVKRDWQARCEYTAPPDIPESWDQALRRSAMAAYRALGCRDVARLDFRADREGRFYFLEANPLPGLNPISGDLVILATRLGWRYNDLILAILGHALERCGLKQPERAGKK